MPGAFAGSAFPAAFLRVVFFWLVFFGLVFLGLVFLGLVFLGLVFLGLAFLPVPRFGAAFFVTAPAWAPAAGCSVPGVSFSSAMALVLC